MRGGVVYYDGQFDDARLLIHLAMTAADHGATLVNYCPAIGLLRDAEGYVNGVTARDEETGEEFRLPARIVVNATGVFTDSIRRMADPSTEPLVVTSQGIHLVFDRSFLRGDTALMVPRTSDGRVLFVIPWHGHAVAGTTDTPVDAPSLEPRPLDEEIEFILETAGRYLTRPPTRADVLSVYVGLRPLVKGDGKTSALSRDHIIHVDPRACSPSPAANGPPIATWPRTASTTASRWAGCATNRARRAICTFTAIWRRAPTAMELKSMASMRWASTAPMPRPYAPWRRQIQRLPLQLDPELPYLAAEVAWAARTEMARTVEDVLARRTRALFLNAGSAIAMAPAVARLLASELGRDQAWVDAQVMEFRQLAEQYRVV